MQLPAFIQRAVDFFDKAEKNHTAETTLQGFRTRQVELEKELSDAKAYGKTQADKTVAAIDQGVKDLALKDAEIVTLKAEVVTEKGRTTEVLASLGIDPSKIPAAPAPKSTLPAQPAGASKIVEQYRAITDSSAQVLFYRANKAAIDADYKAHPTIER